MCGLFIWRIVTEECDKNIPEKIQEAPERDTDTVSKFPALNGSEKVCAWGAKK